MKIIELNEFLNPLSDFHKWDGKKQVDYLSFYLQGATMGGCTWYSTTDIQDLYSKIPLTPYKRIAQYLSEESLKPKGGKYVRKMKSGYVLSKHTYDEIQTSLTKNPRKIAVSVTLKSLTKKIKDEGEAVFLSETIDCYEIGATRASIVMMWTLTVAHLRNLILNKHLHAFNSEVGIWNQGHPKNQLSTINTYDDFGEIPDHRFIELTRSSKIITKEQKHILEDKLKTRNTAGHPTTTIIAPSKADEYIDDLALNILSI